MAERPFGWHYDNDAALDETFPDNTRYLAAHNIFRFGSPQAEDLGREFRRRLDSGERLYLLGFLATSHNSGISLVEASREDGIVVLANCEEERFSGIKHHSGFPFHSVAELRRSLGRWGLSPSRIFGVFYGFDVVHEEQSARRMLRLNPGIIENKYYRFITEVAVPSIELDADAVEQIRASSFSHSPALAAAFRQLVREFGLPASVPCLQMLHHENHAYFSYGASPFAGPLFRDRPTMVACIDGAGDLSSVSLFEAHGAGLRLVKRNHRADSLGVFYMLCASLLGGWTALSAEGRYMGATAWGNGDRLTNPYYKRLRQFFHFAGEGEVFFNAAMAADDFRGLQEVVGPFIAFEDVWKPDAVIDVDSIAHSEITQERVDVAAAVQMVYEDALFHIIGDFIRRTGSDQLVLCGGTALNCVANMKLLEHFDHRFYRRYFNRDTTLKLWVPPIPSDQGVVAGAPYHFAMAHGAEPGGSLPTPFLCGAAPDAEDIEQAIRAADFVHHAALGNVSTARQRAGIADWMAYLVSRGGVVGIYDGEAETGPRALGHRSILSNPCDPETLEVLNSRVKLRERIRPLAPIMTLDEAHRWFELAPGAAANEYDAYSYMVLTVRAKAEAKKVIPAVIHEDGTSRIQIVREENNALMHDYLQALKRRIGVAVSVNTSLNVGSPIVQTPAQALQIFRRSKGMDCIIMVSEEGVAYMVWPKSGVQPMDSRLPDLRRSYLDDEGRTPGVAWGGRP